LLRAALAPRDERRTFVAARRLAALTQIRSFHRLGRRPRDLRCHPIVIDWGDHGGG
jgi:hypothetical protein